MKYLKLFEDQTSKKKSAMQRLLDSGTDPEIVASYKSKYSEKEKEKIKGSEVLVLNALRIEKHLSHFTLQEAINLATELNIPKTYFTHISHQMGLHSEVSPTLPAGMFLAYDGLVITVD
jgi:phosphoribosyl 1,2-cyclic phosphodiesterase